MTRCGRWAAAGLLSALLAGAVYAELPETVERALAALGEADLDAWAFTETTVTNGTAFVERHDPAKPEGQRWTLVSVDGETPTGKQLSEQAARRAREAEDDGDSEGMQVRASIDPDSLTQIEETATHVTYRFDPVASDEDDAKFYEHLDGTLRIAKDGPYVESIEMRSRRPFSAAFGVKVKQFETVTRYAPAGDGGAVLPASVSFRMLGRAMMVKKIDESVEVTFSDYRR